MIKPVEKRQVSLCNRPSSLTEKRFEIQTPVFREYTENTQNAWSFSKEFIATSQSYYMYAYVYFLRGWL